MDDPSSPPASKFARLSGPWGKPDNLLGVTLLLASRASDNVNGQIIYVDVGLLPVI